MKKNNLHIKMRLWRQKNKLTQAKFAEMVGLSTKSINRYEIGGFPKNSTATQEIIKEVMRGNL